jgi:hypothetical protein
MKKIILKATKTIICYLHVFMSFKLSAQWTQTTFTASNNPSISSIVTDGINIYASTYGASGIFKSSNGGNSWTAINNGLSGLDITDIISVGSVVLESDDYNTKKSINQGANWLIVSGYNTNKASFAKKDSLVFARGESNITKSVDYGNTWANVYGLQFNQIFGKVGIYVQDSTIYAAGENFDLLISHNLGTTWANTGIFTSGGGSDNVHSITCIDTVVFASNVGDGICKSNDKGLTWNLLANSSNLFCGTMIKDSTALLIQSFGVGGILRSTDMGASWTTIFNKSNVRSISIINTEIFVGTEDGQIWKSSKIFPDVSFTNMNCSGDSTGSITITSPGNGAAPFQYSIDNGVSYQSSNTFTSLAAGSYSIIVKDANNVLSQLQLAQLVAPPLLNTPSTIVNATCGMSNGQITTTGTGGVGPYAYAWSNGNNTSNLINVASGVYTLAVTDFNSCVKTLTFAVNTNPIANAIPICAISADSLSTHNIVIWEKTSLPSTIDTFWVFRETSSNVFSKIGKVSNDSISEFHDYSANPNATSYKYKIGAINTCGDTTSALSNFHNTIHLQYLGLGNLLWSLYNIENSGNPVNFYIVNRDDLGNGNFVPISSTIPGSNTSFTDVNYTNFPNAKYRVDVNWNITCNSTQKMYSTIKSNIISIAVTGANEMEIANNFQVYPNPFKSETTIQFANEQKNTLVKVLDILGKEITHINVNGKKHVFYNDNLEAGIYFFQLIDNNKSSAYRKVIVE